MVVVITSASLMLAQGQTRSDESRAKLRAADEAAIMKVLDNFNCQPSDYG